MQIFVQGPGPCRDGFSVESKLEDIERGVIVGDLKKTVMEKEGIPFEHSP